jgi:hypothetical protein
MVRETLSLIDDGMMRHWSRFAERIGQESIPFKWIGSAFSETVFMPLNRAHGRRSKE